MAMTSIYPSARISPGYLEVFAKFNANRFLLFLKIGVSLEFRYFAPLSSSALPPNATTLPPKVNDREHHAVAEPVESVSLFAFHRNVCFYHFLLGVAFGLEVVDQSIPVIRRIAQTKVTDGLAVTSALNQILIGRLFPDRSSGNYGKSGRTRG